MTGLIRLPESDDWRRLGFDPAAVTVTEILRHRPTHAVLRLQADERRLVLKWFAPETNEGTAFGLLAGLGVPTLPLLASTATAMLFDDLDAGGPWRLARPSDQEAAETGAAIAAWYKRLHTAGAPVAAGHPGFLQRWVDSFDRDDLVGCGGALGIGTEPSWTVAVAQVDALQDRFRELPATLVYDDFDLENLALSRSQPLQAIVFDYGELSIGPSVSDWRNVRWSLSGEALRGFDGSIPRPDDLHIHLDMALTTLYSLLVASRRPALPSWALPSIDDVTSGRLGAEIAAALGG